MYIAEAKGVANVLLLQGPGASKIELLPLHAVTPGVRQTCLHLPATKGWLLLMLVSPNPLPK